MTRQRICRWIFVVVAAWSIILSPLASATEPSTGMVKAPAVLDVRLDADGSLRGHVTSESGQPLPAAKVSLLQSGQVVAATSTQDKGQFVVPAVRPGLYELNSARASTTLRVWSHRSAPPAARTAALLVDGPVVVRGQQWSPAQRALILGGVIITSGVIGGVIGYTIGDDAS